MKSRFRFRTQGSVAMFCTASGGVLNKRHVKPRSRSINTHWDGPAPIDILARVVGRMAESDPAIAALEKYFRYAMKVQLPWACPSFRCSGSTRCSIRCERTALPEAKPDFHPIRMNRGLR